MSMIRRKTALEAWQAVLRGILDEGKDFKDNDGRVCREMINMEVVIEHPDVAPDEPIDKVRKINKWFYPSKEELVNIIFNQFELPLYEYTYGSRLFGFRGKVDQVNGYVIPLLKKNPTSRRATTVVMDPTIDMQMHNRNAPGLVSLHFKIVDGALSMTGIIRSNDFFIGWPANVYQASMLQKYVAEELGVRIGPLTTYSFSAHLFEEYMDDIRSVLS